MQFEVVAERVAGVPYMTREFGRRVVGWARKRLGEPWR
jgi:hypothetical protein